MALNAVEWQREQYPMDYYSNDSLGAWTVNNEKHRPLRGKAARLQKASAENKAS